jgi:hypothetical protein
MPTPNEGHHTPSGIEEVKRHRSPASVGLQMLQTSAPRKGMKIALSSWWLLIGAKNQQETGFMWFVHIIFQANVSRTIPRPPGSFEN